MLPTFDSGKDALWVSGPDEGFGIGVGLCDEAVDGGLEVGDGAEHAALEAAPCELGEEAFDGVEPGCRGGSEVEGPARMLGQPFSYLGMLMGGIVVDDSVDRLGAGDFCVDGVEEANELLVPMPWRL